MKTIFEEHINIFTSPEVAMQRIADAVRHGYTYYSHGTVSIDRCLHVVKKLDLNYRVLADRNERARRARLGLGNAKLILWLNQGVIHRMLMVTAPELGDHAAHSIEDKLRNANSAEGRIEIDGFELVRLPKKINPKFKSARKAKSASNTTVLTWRMSELKYQEWRDRIRDEVRTQTYRSIELAIYKLFKSPRFSAIRSQIGHLANLYRAEVKRAGRADAPALPKHLGYVRRLKNQGVTLAVLIAQRQAQIASSIARLDLEDKAQHSSVILVSDVAVPAVGSHAL
jgi:hypothetical protein